MSIPPDGFKRQAKLQRIIMHWTAGRHRVSATDKAHYHEIVSGFGERVKGVFLPEHNLDSIPGQHAAHTKDLNSGSIGLSMAAMYGAQERPLYVGAYGITRRQLDVFCKMTAEYCLNYEIDVARETVLTHAEVQQTLGVKQRGKWDITILPGMAALGDPIEVGDQLRAMIDAQIKRGGA